MLLCKVWVVFVNAWGKLVHFGRDMNYPHWLVVVVLHNTMTSQRHRATTLLFDMRDLCSCKL